MAKTYGVPYQGSKSRLAERIVELLPPAGALYDLFAGGCAVAHCALLSGKWRRVVANDVTDSALFFGDVAAGRYRGRHEWIGREDFARLKDADAWVRLVWSFGNDQRTYLYGMDVEPYKRAVHGMLTAGSVAERRRAFREVVRMAEGLIASGRTRVTCDMEPLERVQRLEELEELEGLEARQGITGMWWLRGMRWCIAIFRTGGRGITGEWILTMRRSMSGRWHSGCRCLYRSIGCRGMGLSAWRSGSGRARSRPRIIR